MQLSESVSRQGMNFQLDEHSAAWNNRYISRGFLDLMTISKSLFSVIIRKEGKDKSYV
jgi:hypothetical protein